MKTKAFTLIELIVVITIFVILSTISFIALQGYSTDARDAKRISDINNLLSKVNIETTKGALLEDLITYRTQTGITINNENGITNMGIINFENLKENQESFQDPINKEDYKFAFSEGITNINGKDENYKFIQMATVNERNKTTQLIGNYYQIDSLTDSPSLFIDEEGNPIKSGLQPMIYNPNKKLYEGVAGIIQGTQNYTEKGFTRRELIIKDGNGKGYTIMDRNLGATEEYNGVEKNSVWGNYYQWGNNYGFPNSGNITTGSTLTAVTRPYSSSIFIPGVESYRYDWVEIQNDDLWGELTNTNIARKGPCGNGRHVPSVEEWRGFIYAYLHDIKGVSSYTFSDNIYQRNEVTLDTLQNDLKLPLNGRRVWDNSGLTHQGSFGLYWSSSLDGSNVLRLYLCNKEEDNYINVKSRGYRSYAVGIRCFKN